MSRSPDVTRGTMTEWANALRPVEPELARKIDVPRQQRDSDLERLSLPRYRQVVSPLTEFLNDPTTNFDALGSSQFFIDLSPNEDLRSTGLRRLRNFGLNREQVLDFIRERVSGADTDKYTCSLKEFFKNELSGTIVIGRDGGFFVEAADGDHLPLARGEKTPDYFVERDEFTQTFKYLRRTEGRIVQLEDEVTRDALRSALFAIPHQGSGRSLEFTPGYYEFTMVHREPDGPLVPIFLDYADSQVYEMSAVSVIS